MLIIDREAREIICLVASIHQSVCLRMLLQLPVQGHCLCLWSVVVLTGCVVADDLFFLNLMGRITPNRRYFHEKILTTDTQKGENPMKLMQNVKWFIQEIINSLREEVVKFYTYNIIIIWLYAIPIPIINPVHATAAWALQNMTTCPLTKLSLSCLYILISETCTQALALQHRTKHGSEIRSCTHELVPIIVNLFLDKAVYQAHVPISLSVHMLTDQNSDQKIIHILESIATSNIKLSTNHY